MYPQASIPSNQLSLLRGLNPAAQLALGNALRELKDKYILVIGSGFLFHNMRAFAWEGPAAPDPAKDAFRKWPVRVAPSRGHSLSRNNI
jgi:4,5-DOPA dioxygenase extradiol